MRIGQQSKIYLSCGDFCCCCSIRLFDFIFIRFCYLFLIFFFKSQNWANRLDGQSWKLHDMVIEVARAGVNVSATADVQTKTKRKKIKKQKSLIFQQKIYFLIGVQTHIQWCSMVKCPILTTTIDCRSRIARQFHVVCLSIRYICSA